MNATFVFSGDAYVGEIIAKKLTDAGFVLAEDMSHADYVFTYCLTQTELEDAYFESDGALHLAKEGACFVDLSPSSPSFAKEVYALAQVSEMEAIDAPLVIKDICDHDAFGNRDNLVMLVGAEDEVFDKAKPLLEALAATVRHLGMPGSGQLAKSVQTVQLAAQLVSLIEGWAIGKANSADIAQAMEAAVADGFVAPPLMKVYQAIADSHFHGTYTAQVLMSEIAAVLNGADDEDLILPQAEACMHLVELFMVVGGTDLSATALSLVYGDEEECKEHGLDWSRAENLYDGGHEHHHDHEHDEDDEEYDDDEDEDEFPGGFGGFSTN